MSVGNLFLDNRQKYLYSFADSNFSVFVDGMLSVSHRIFNAESFNKTSLTIDEIGLRLRGTVYHNLGFYLRASNGQQLNGDYYARTVAANFDPRLHSTLKFLSQKYTDSYEGYLRYETDNRAVALTLGREGINFGTGYIDKLFISNNAVPFDYGKIDIGYKGIRYSFFYGNIKGDSLGVPLQSKNFVAHRLDVSISKSFKFGIYEGIIIADRPLSFTYMNPVSFLFSADLTAQSDNTSNSLLGTAV